MPLYTVGKHTAIKAQLAGFSHVVMAGEDVYGLIETIEKDFKSSTSQSKLLYASGNVVHHDLGKKLIHQGIDTTRIIVYDSIVSESLQEDTLSLLAAGTLKAIVFYSKRSAETFMKIIEKSGYLSCLRGITAYTLSAHIAQALPSEYFSDIKIATEPTQDALLSLIESTS
jgi:uroporphyrinogen-III synthase